MFLTDVLESKKSLRLEMKARRALLNESERARASWSMCQRVSSFLATRPERTLGVFLARPQEICLDILIGELLRDGYEIAAPRVDIQRGEMSFWRLEDLEATEIGPWNVREPPPTQKMSDIPLFLVPGLSFDRAGRRLGTGGGWYDRTLSSKQSLIGVCFDCQLVPRVPTEEFDRNVHFVATENRWIEVE